jgi:HAD superfamily hydrolase (TIGR01490 family)
LKKRIAVFDIDGTLLKGSSAEGIFVRYLLSTGELTVSDGARFIRRFVTTFFRNWIEATKSNRFYLKHKSVRRIEELAKGCFRIEIAPKISEAARRTIEEHRSSGLEIVLLSGTPDVLLKCFVEELAADHAHGSTLEIAGDRYTGNMRGVHPYGSAKADIVRAHYDLEDYDLSASYAYANHSSDFEFLELFGHPFLANPAPRLAKRAKERGFDTVYF